MNNLQSIKEQLEGNKLDAMLIASPVACRWATGLRTSAGALLVTKGENLFITDSRYIEVARAQIQGAKVEMVETGMSYTGRIEEFLTRQGVKRLGFEQDTMTQGAYVKFSRELTAEMLPAQAMIDDLREVKSQAEYKIMQQAQDITDKTFAEVVQKISKDMTEEALAAELVYRLMKNGGEKPAFDPIVVGGSRSSMPHGRPGSHKLEGFVTIDFGAVYQGYCADMTRTIAIGEPTEEMKNVYEIVRSAQLAGIKAARGGMIGKEIDKAARDVIDKAGYGSYFGHGLGHSLGLEVHESLKASPTETRPIPTGAIISIEPGIYLPGKFGVRIEDTIYLTETGNEILTKTTKELIIL